jgi:hypothetical protein
MMFNMFHGTLQPLAGASRTISQLAEDGLLPRIFEKRSRQDVPWVATCITASMALLFLLLGDPIWVLAAANFTYLIGICLPNVAVWLLRRNQPDAPRPYRAPRGMIGLGLAAAMIWSISAILGFQQFGMKAVLVGVLFACSGCALYAWRRFSDRRRAGLAGIATTLHIKLTGAMLLVPVLGGAGYLLAVTSLPDQSSALVSVLEDIFVAVVILSISVGLVLPGIIANAMTQISDAANSMAKGAMASFSNALLALGRGDLDAAHARVSISPVQVHSGDEAGEMAKSFNRLQQGVAHAAASLDQAREELRQARHDTLTGLITRREFERRLDAALAKTRRNPMPFALLYLDLDHFKVVNDTCGHAAGDELLRQVTGLLRARQSAIVTASRGWAATSSRFCWRIVLRSRPSASLRSCCRASRRIRSAPPRNCSRSARASAWSSSATARPGCSSSCARPTMPVMSPRRKAAIAFTSISRQTARWPRAKARSAGWDACAMRWTKAAFASTRRIWSQSVQRAGMSGIRSCCCA